MLIAIFESLIYEGGASSGTGDIGVIRNTVIGLKLRTQPILISLFFWEKTASSARAGYIMAPCGEKVLVMISGEHFITDL